MNFCLYVQKDLHKMNHDEESSKSWEIPAELPVALVLKTVRKQNYHRLKFSLRDGCSKVLTVWDPRPNEYYRYGC